jgi:type III secretion system needle length determinant
MSIIKTENAGTVNRVSAAKLEKHRPEPSADDQRRMKHALRDSRRESEEHGGRASSGESILHGLFSANKSASPEALLQADGAGGPNLRDLAALSEIADQVLVSSSESSQREIRIHVKDSLIPETDIRLSRQGGVLSVHLVTTNEQSAHFLAVHRERLQQQLENRLGETVRVDVQGEDSTDSGDGRSRQQRDIYAELGGADKH